MQKGNYDDLSVRARADLADEELERFKTYELMAAGVVRESRPAILDDEPRAVDLERETWWQVGPCVFESAEGAAAFLELEPHTAEYDYKAGYDNKYAKPVEHEVESAVRLIDRAAYEEHVGALVDYEKQKEARDKARKAWEKSERRVNEIIESIDRDYWESKRQVVVAKRIVAVFREYEETAGGDSATAAAFLVKAYDRDTCAEAFELTGNEELVEFLPAIPEVLDAEGDVIHEPELEAELDAEAEDLVTEEL